MSKPIEKPIRIRTRGRYCWITRLYCPAVRPPGSAATCGLDADINCIRLGAWKI